VAFTNLTINGCEFTQKVNDLNSAKVTGTYLFVGQEANVTVQNSYFERGIAKRGGSIFMLGESSLFVFSSWFENSYSY